MRSRAALGAIPALAALLAAEAWSAPKPASGRLAFSSDKDSKAFYQIYTMAPDGSGLTQLTKGKFGNWHPAWSPDGKRLVFTSTREGQDRLYFMKADGSDLARLLPDGVAGREPAWSPDGKTIVFMAKDPVNTAQVHVVAAKEGSKPHKLTWTGTHKSRPSWSPDGKRILYQESVVLNYQATSGISVMKADGAESRELTSSAARDAAPAWSPDGASIVFVRGAGDLFVMKSDGSEQRKLAGCGNCRNPAWSPDGRRIVFERADQLDSVDSRGGGPQLMTQFKALYPAWSRR